MTAHEPVKFCMNMYLHNCKTSIEFQGHRSKVKVTGPDFWIRYCCDLGPCCGGAENARLENAELENPAQNRRGGKRETGKPGTKSQGWKTRDRKTGELQSYGKPSL